MATGAETEFIEEMTRSNLVQWADHQIRFGVGENAPPIPVTEPYLSMAVEKGWVSVKGERPKVLAKGFAAAAAYLRR